MSYEPLHHKYRPQTFADLVGQEAITTTLTNAILSKRIAPAYLFTGPRGTGKTSSARILAKSLNCLSSPNPTPSPCGTCEVCRAIAIGSALDVIEIDAASNTGVDNIREIIERSQFAPVQCRYKVYAIDECHMLSTAAFNALLKTLEEPPDRVVFVLATTDPQRVLPTIISRCQRFDYRRIPLEAMVTHLQYIATQEEIEIEAEAITLVAQIANGGLRDAESLLDQLSLLTGTITPEKVWDLVGAVPERDLLTLLQAIASNHPQAVLEQCRHLMNRGREPLVVLQNLASFYLNLLITKTASDRADLVAVTSSTWQALQQEAQQWDLTTILRGQQHLKDSETQLKQTTQPRLWLEVTLLGLLPVALSHSGVRSQNSGIKFSSASPSSPTLHTSEVSQSPQVSPMENKGIGDRKLGEESPKSPKFQNLDSEAAYTPHTLEVSPASETPEAYPIQPIADKTVQNGEQIWQSVLTNLPTWTQALVRPHCHLIRFEGTVAYIGIKAEPLLRHAQGKIGEIETAFETVCHHKVKVHLEVIRGTSSASTSSQSPAKQNPSPTPSKPIEPIEPEESSESSFLQNSASVSKIPPSSLPSPASTTITNQNGHSPIVTTQQNGAKVTQPEVIVSPISEPEFEVSDRADNEKLDQSEVDIQKAAASLAKFFEGELVILENYIQDEEASRARKQLQDIDTQGSKSEGLSNHSLASDISQPQPSENNKPMIQGRPDSTQILDDEDIPF